MITHTDTQLAEIAGAGDHRAYIRNLLAYHAVQVQTCAAALALALAGFGDQNLDSFQALIKALQELFELGLTVAQALQQEIGGVLQQRNQLIPVQTILQTFLKRLGVIGEALRNDRL